MPDFAQYLWGDGETTKSITVAPPINGSKLATLEVTDINGCKATDQVNVISHPTLGNILDNIADEMCVNSSISISPIKSQIFKHEWFFNGVSNSTDNFIPTIEGTIELTVWNEHGCSVKENIVVHAPQIQMVGGINEAILCYKTPYEFGVVPDVDYNYKWSNNSAGLTFEPTEEGDYWVKMTHNTLGCEAKTPIKLSWHPGLLFNVKPNLSVCQSGLNYRIQGDVRMTDYEWRVNADPTIISTDNNILAYATDGDKDFHVNANYYPPIVALPNVYSPTAACPLTQDFNFRVVPEPDPLDINDSKSCGSPDYIMVDGGRNFTVKILCICTGEKIELRGFNDFSTYQWAKNNGTILVPDFIDIAGANSSFYEVTAAGIYRLTAQQPNTTDGSPGCISIGIVEVVINNNPDLNIGTDRSVCPADLFTIANTGADHNDHTYVWKYNDDLVLSGAGADELINQSKQGDYSVKATGLNSCVSNAKVTVKKPAIPEIGLLSQVICEGETVNLATKWTTEVDPSTFDYVSHQWFIKTDLVNPLADMNQSPVAGNYTYTLKVTIKSDPTDVTAPDCDFLYDFNLLVRPKPAFNITAQPALEVCQGETILLESDAVQPFYKWIETATPASTLSTKVNLTVNQSGQIPIDLYK
jgi:hypothetical protein